MDIEMNTHWKYTRCCILWAVIAVAAPSEACDSGTIRQAAFEGPRDMHRLCVIANADDTNANKLHASLKALLDPIALDLNLELLRINAGDPETDWTSVALPSMPPSLPVTILAGWDSVHHRPFLIDHWEPAPTEEEMAVLVSSPAREAVQQGTAEYWAVLLHAKGTGEQNPDIQAAIDAVEKKWADAQPPGVQVVSLNRSDPKERSLCAFIGLAPSGPDWVGVVYGRGKLLAPPLSGDSITEENLNKLVETLLQPCTCVSPGTSLGVDLPMLWGKAHAECVIPLGSDAYIETGTATVNAGKTQPPSPTDDSPAPSRRVPGIVLGILVVSAILVLAIGIVLMRRSDQ